MKLLTKLLLSIFLFTTFVLEIPNNVLAQDKNQDNVQIIPLTEDEIEKFKEELAKRSQNNNVTEPGMKDSTLRTAAAPAAIGALAAFVGETFWIPGIGQAVLITAAGVTVAGVTWYAGSWIYDTVVDYLTSSTAEKYEKAKKAGQKTTNHYV